MAAEKHQAGDPGRAGTPGGRPPPLRGNVSGQLSRPQQAGSALYPLEGGGPVAAEKHQAGDPEGETHEEVADKGAADGRVRVHPV